MYEVVDMDHLGRGIIKKDGKVVFVNNAITGDIIEIEVTKEKKNYSEARIKKIITSSTNRRKVNCKYYGVCGGCDLMHSSYDFQIKYKKDKVINIIKRYSNLDINPMVIESDKEYNYRNKITLHSSNNGLGFNKKNSNEIIYIDSCLLANNKINDVIPTLKSDKDVILRTSDNEVISNISEKSTLIKNINGLKFKIHYNSFFQVNDYICGKLFDIVKKFVNKDDIVLDLYSGVATLSIVASFNAKQVFSVEINENAHKNALENILLNNRNNIFPTLSDSSKFVLSFDKYFNTLIVDPPRSGLDENTRNFILKRKPEKILYVSCDPMSLGRDLNILKDKYQIEESYILDMFPNTHHIESCLLLYLKEN